jgi:hypothetical protein
MIPTRSSLCSFLTLLSLNSTLVQIFSSAPCSQTPSSFLKAKDKVSHPYRNTGKIVILYILLLPLKTADQLQRELNASMTAIQEAAWNNKPFIKTELKGLNFMKEIRKLIAEKPKLSRKWHQSRNPHDKNLNRASQQLYKEIKTIKQSLINKFLTELTQDSSTDYSLWKATKYLKRPIAQVPHIKKKDGRWACKSSRKKIHLRNILKKDSIHILDWHINGS